MPVDPIARFQRWYAAARHTRIVQPDAMALATSDGRGRPSARMVLLKQADAAAYWATRPRASQLAALASDQSAPMSTRARLVARWRGLTRRYRGRPVPRPPHWGGYRLVPDAVEFWTHREHRLHDRELFRRTGRSWKRTRLQP